MNNESVAQRLKKMLVTDLNLDRTVESIADDESLFKEGLKLDSVDTLEIVLSIEKEFGLVLDEEKTKKHQAVFKTVGSLAAFVEQELSKK